MAEVYPKVKEGFGRGKKLTRIVALHADVQARLQLEAELGAHRADANLAIIRDKPGYNITGGHSNIEVAAGNVDRYVILSDERGLGAAMTIEYGRKAAEQFVGDAAVVQMSAGTEGAYILHDAMKFSRGSGDRPEVLEDIMATDGDESA